MDDTKIRLARLEQKFEEMNLRIERKEKLDREQTESLTRVSRQNRFLITVCAAGASLFIILNGFHARWIERVKPYIPVVGGALVWIKLKQKKVY
ncbi:hypothetical protein ACQ4M3_09760 [Leptolyngbya sp. AN03gr2]|uniref:hypothetical protein n=1 Tax=Leptolyngbya sp. AN03gr2 TaxID=3423364 RepID=UPI003D3116E6